MVVDCVVIGAGLAGLQAARRLRDEGVSGESKLVRKNLFVFNTPPQCPPHHYSTGPSSLLFLSPPFLSFPLEIPC
jgi:flavin-dependent dehydrogenase